MCSTWSLQGRFGAALVRAWAPLGLNLEPLGHNLGPLGLHSRSFERLLGPLGRLLCSSWSLSRSTCALLKRFWTFLGSIWAPSGLRMASRSPSDLQVASECSPSAFLALSKAFECLVRAAARQGVHNRCALRNGAMQSHLAILSSCSVHRDWD